MTRDQEMSESIWLPTAEWREKHDLSEDVCTVGHVRFDGTELVSRGQCRWCSRCIQWIRPKNFDGPCNPASHREDKED